MKSLNFRKVKFGFKGLNPDLFLNNLNNFYDNFFMNYIGNKNTLVIIKVRNKNTKLYTTITPIQSVSKKDYDLLKNILNKTIELRSDLVPNIDKIVFIYRHFKSSSSSSKLMLDPRLFKNLDFLKLDNIMGYNVPVTMDLNLWLNNTYKIFSENNILILQSLEDTNISYKITNYTPGYKWMIRKVELIDIKNNANILFYDIIDEEDNGLNTFIRFGHNFLIHYIEGYRVFSMNL